VDGESQIKYLYSSDVSIYNIVMQNLLAGSNGGTIFLPATGYFWGDDITNGGSRGCYWLSTLNPSNLANAYHMGFYSGGVYLDVQYGRRCGRCVRPVFNK
jgi:hypothetical protein